MPLSKEEEAELADIEKRLAAYEQTGDQGVLERAGRGAKGAIKAGSKVAGEALRAGGTFAKTFVNVMNPFGGAVDPAGQVRARGPTTSAREENNWGQVVKDVARPENAGAIYGSEVGRRTGADIGQKIGGSIPGGPLTKATGALVGRGAGSLIGRLGGAYVGGAATKGAKDIMFGYAPHSEEDLDHWFNELHSEGKGQVSAEAIGAGAQTLGHGVKALARWEKPKASLDVKALAGWAHDNFKRALRGMEEDSAQSVADKALQERYKRDIDPVTGERVAELGGMTIAEKQNSRTLDLLQGISAGSASGGGTIRQMRETRDNMSRLVALQLGMDVGPKLDPADLYDLIQKGVGGEFEKGLSAGQKLNIDEYVANVMSNDMLHNVPDDLLVKVNMGRKRTATPRTPSKNFVGPAAPPRKDISLDRRFQWINDLNGQRISVEQYRQYRDQLMKITRSKSVSDEYKAEAGRLVGLLDKGVYKQLPPGAADTLRTIQKVEGGHYTDDMRANFVKGLLLAKNGPRDFVERLSRRPDYKKVTLLLNLVPDEEVRQSLRREVVDKLLGDSLMPGGKLRAQPVRKNIERTVGREALEKITSPETVRNIDNFTKYREHLEAYKERGEPGRVMIALTQGSQFAGLMTALGSGGLLGGRIEEVAFGNPGVAVGIGLLLGPAIAAKALTSPFANQYVKFAKLAARPGTNVNRLKARGKQLLETMGETQLASHLFGRVADAKWGNVEGDAEATQYMQEKYKPRDPTIQKPPGNPPTASPANMFPEGVELGR